MDVSIIIVNYNTLDLTKNTIESVFEKTKGLNYEVILVDNASTDGSIEFFENSYKDKVIFIKNNENLGFGRANNKGIEIAKGKYIFLLNSDTLLKNNAIKILYDFMEKNNNCGICGGNLYTLNNDPLHSFFPDLPYVTIKTEAIVYLNFIEKICRKILKRKRDFNYTNTPKVVGCITGADMMLRKSILDKVGIFDEDFFMYSEEIELTYRVYRSGYLSYSVPEAKIIHLEGKSITFKENRFRMGLESKYKYFYKTSNLKICKYAYYISQLGHLLSLILRINKDYWKMYKINKEEYKKFLENYKNLKKNY
ncbi:dTDP-Rha:alpha-D-GlcNAc-pyrophosphate polyprenol, alpha-3-L-rhamnosyltransferase [Fusobacterium necrogenes]|uniref:dTDP-Rha:alpha-D-GlcNAc-pyrophosphate polyprenol, alpha-3-L-rhamnosyltransferase n=1 Tax=Fusobacterium necrogenes TaxID=858 RepID=A0A377GV44_9FUSO|nr:glycosyltransferase family 2 protein [Fusobacterium necrogenes]STO30816.1 dTDP-Rha:alpha-D-GlcNAc-pyrophosphate polyprenol, alpha-3-L-rhamnosyltransferase [Fusobacterium necrogenes]